MKVKVAVILPYFGSGGAETMVAHLTSHFDLNRLNVQVYCIYGEPLKNHLEKEVQSHGIKIIFIGKKLGFSIKAVFKLYKELNIFKPDIVHTHLMACMYATPWVLTHNIKMLHTLHSIPQSENSYFIRKITTSFLYKIKKAVPVAISIENQKLIAEYYNMKKESIEVVNNPVITRRYYHRKMLGDTITLITVGRLSKEKNQIMMIEVFKELYKEYSNIKFMIVGDGEERKSLEKKAQEYKIDKNIIFVGRVVNVEDYLCDADIFLLSSFYEGVPLSILEAMAARLPIISTNVGGVKDIVTNNGILVQSNNIEAMKNAILKLIKNKNLRIKMGENSLMNIKKYDVENIAEEYTRLYEKFSCKKTSNWSKDETN